MAFLRSLFSGVSALRNHQTMMDVIGNNIANVNTVGFKAGRTTFSELYAQTVQGASRPTATNGGTNPMQVGLGMSVSTIDTLFTAGNIETTAVPFDLAISGQGMFIVDQNGQTLYTRAGNFSLDADGHIVTATGAKLQGKMANTAGVVPGGTRLEDLIINRDLKSLAQASSYVEYAGNLDSSAAVGATAESSASVFDSLGNRITLKLTFTKVAENQWSWSATIPDTSAATGERTVGGGALVYNTDGTLQSTTGNQVTFTPAGGASPLTLDLRFGTTSASAPGVFSGITQTGGSSSISRRNYDGHESGTLTDVKFDIYGKVLGSFSNGTVQTLAQVMLAEFNNVEGLERMGDNMYALSANSGIPSILEPGEVSTLTPGALEQSNVDLADEFTKMIMAQRGFQANARVISTSDELLQELVNLKM